MSIEILLYALIFLVLVHVVITLLRRPVGNSGVLGEELRVIKGELARIDPSLRSEFARNREEGQKSFKENREELSNSFTRLGDTLSKTVTDLSGAQKSQFEIFAKQLAELVRSFDEKTNNLQVQLDKSAKDNRQEQATSLKSFEDKFTQNVKEFNELQKQKFDDLANKHDVIKRDTENKLKEIRETVENRLTVLSEENGKKLEEMRKTVDDKLQETVEKRFNESFKMISDRLEQVHKGLGEMQTLASGVGDLKKVLTNVKTRGSLGEIQLGAILEQMFSPEHYERNAAVKKGSQERVEYVIKLPGQHDDNRPLLLPIDSKFPNEDYQRLLDIYERAGEASQQEIDAVSKQFQNAIKKNARDIRDKYINPPDTTDFAIMFVPTEGLYAEILRCTGLFELLRNDYKVVVVGPTNLVAFLNSLQMGFRTLAIQKRSSEVWEVLATVKTEFGRFGDVLEKTKKKLQEASNTIDQAGVRSRAIERRLKTVQQLSPPENVAKLGNVAIDLDDETENIALRVDEGA